MPLITHDGMQRWRLDPETIAEIVDIATEQDGGIAEDGSVVLLCLPMVQLSRKTDRFLQNACREAGLKPNHENLVRAALHHCMDFAIDERGNITILD